MAGKLDSLFVRLAKCRERLQRVPEILQQFREAVLDAAVSGRLTEEWRSGADSAATQELRFDDAILQMPRSWKVSSLAGLLSESRPLCYGVVQPGEMSLSGVNLIRVQDLERGTIRIGGLRTISAQVDEEYRRSRVEGGDLLVSVVGTIGRTAIVPLNLKANIARAIARIACRSAVDPQWVKLWLDSPTLQWWLTKSAREVARKTLNLSELGKVVVGIPSEREQAEIVRRAATLLSIADSIEDRVQSARARTDGVRSAILAKAFRGELVTQNPRDESATEMLERIKEERTAEGSGLREATVTSHVRRHEERSVREDVGGRMIGRKGARKTA